MKRVPVIFDCDTGVDDAVAILAALRIPSLDILGFTCVRGNAGLEKTVINTLHVLEVAGVEKPVYPGAVKPLFSEPVPGAVKVHGENGLGDIPFDAPKQQPQAEKAWDYIYAEAERQNGELELIATGPLTNLAMAFIKYSNLPKLLKRIVIMGGAASFGNVTPSAEFNIYADPEAADIVFTSGVKVHMCGLDVTMKAWMNEEEIAHWADGSTPVGTFARDVVQGTLRWSRSIGLPGMSMHDPCAVLYAAYPELFKTDSVGVRVETKGRITRGKTVTDFLSDKQFDFKNTEIVYDVDRTAFKNKLTELLTK